MLFEIGLIQLCVFIFFYTLERFYPDKNHPVAPFFNFWWMALGLFALLWLRVVFFIWIDLPKGLIEIDAPIVAQGFIFYLFYSCGNYWFHRWKHSNHFLWRYIHHLHHSPSQMETKIAFYRHPLEILTNTVYLIALGKFLFDLPFEALAIALAIEGCLECFHHSNIRFPKKLYWLGYVFQLPGMHLVHHEYGLHKYNYAPFLWDTVFGTLKISHQWKGRLGFSQSNDIRSMFLFRKRT